MHFDKPGGFRWLNSWVMGSIVHLATFRFCEKFMTRRLDPTGRLYAHLKLAERKSADEEPQGQAMDCRIVNVWHERIRLLQHGYMRCRDRMVLSDAWR